MVGGFSGHSFRMEAAASSKESTTALDEGAQEENGRQEGRVREVTREGGGKRGYTLGGGVNSQVLSLSVAVFC